MDSQIQQINNQFIKLICVDNNIKYNAYVRVGSVTGIIDHGSRCTIITAEKTYHTESSITTLKSKLGMVIA
ncbi:hypothetical protein [Psychrobacter sp. MES7-P7E]|uniref:hypothetical protein n=1 Tax=Psychrobacter sp. MES7-P7E TaxID=2058322 RepID=UPI000C7ED65C|nr:hypothetical protein [Psychrobacter sp. MES7-P7E]PLT21544.1 hypothetical protein CXF62_09965 [Psychrobacter sp. MES7-P7E]